AWAAVGASVFEVSPAGDVLYGAWDLRVPIPRNSEPVAIAYNPLDGFFYASNNAANRIYRYAFTPGAGFTVDDYFKHTLHEAGSSDPEGITVDTTTGVLYIIDGTTEVIHPFVYDEDGAPAPGDSGPPGSFVFLDPIDLHALNPPEQVIRSPQGIAFDPASGHLLLVSQRDRAVFEYTTGGLFVVSYDLSALGPALIAAKDLAISPTGALFGAASESVVHIVDAGIDNNVDPAERDGTMFVVELRRLNSRPEFDAIPDVVAEENSAVSVSVTASDADAGDQLSFSLVGSVPEGATIDPLTGQFLWVPGEAHAPGGHLVSVRVTDDGEPPASSEATFLVTVTEVNEPPVLEPIGDWTVAPGAEVAFPIAAADPDTGPALAEGLLAYWPFDADTEIVRSATGARDGTRSEGATIERGPGGFVLGGGALALDGDGGYVAFGDLPLAGDFSVTAWVRPENLGSRTTSEAVVLGDSANEDWIRLQDTGVRVSFSDVKDTLATSSDFVNGPWQHLGLVRRDGAMTVYRNGEVVHSGEAQPLPFTPERIGRKSPSTNYFAGLLDDLAVWDRALDGDEIALLDGGGAGRAVGDAGTIAMNTLAFGLEATALQATIDASTGFFSMTAPAEPGDYAFTVTVTDDGDPPGMDQQTFTVTVASGEGGQDAVETTAPAGAVVTCPDLDGDGWVDMSDLLELLAAWAMEGGASIDIDGDGLTSASDIDAMLGRWGPCG
ncbi:MAG: putative Ig domain-containing protein, partial [Chloroflexi bacterium]|nr:putative Ig domain-containing protein [Chloroflexota bacterium]